MNGAESRPGAPAALVAALAPLVVDPAATVLLFDFDGTLSPIVDDPALAAPLPGVTELLDRLAARYRTVGAVSGRPVDFLAAHLPPSVALSGLYGLEAVVGGRRVEHPTAPTWRDQVAGAVADARRLGPADLLVEAKGLSATLHYRGRPELADVVRALAGDLADGHGLEARAAKMSVELHPRVDADKGHAVRDLARGASAVLYAGDDLGDLPAFGALAELRAAGLATVGVAVVAPELPEAVRAAADVLVDGPSGVLDLLRALLA